MSFFGTFPNLRISRIAAAVPANRIPNQAFVQSIGEEGIKKFESMTGIKERRHVMNLSTSCLARRAAERIFTDGDVPKNSIGAVIFVSQTPDYQLPATACVMQNDLGLPADVAAFDVNLGCSGFVYGLWQAGAILASGACEKVLLVGGDTLSRITAPDDYANRMLFGDAGFACVLEKNPEKGQSVPWSLGSDGSGSHVIFAGRRNGTASIGGQAVKDEWLHMDGLEVFNFTTSAIPGALKAFAEKSGVEIGAFDSYCFHQANKFILKQIAMLSGFSARKLLYSIEEFGNTSSASIPLTLCANRDRLPGKSLMAGFGVGLSWGVISYDFSNTELMAVEEMEEC